MLSLTKEEQKKLRAFKKQAQSIVDRIAEERGKLRDLLSEYENILETVNYGLEDLEAGIDRISSLL